MIAVASTILAYLTSGTLQVVLIFFAVGGAFGAMLLLSRGLSAQHRAVSSLRKHVRKLERRGSTSIDGSPRGRLGFDEAEASRERLVRSREKVASLRSVLALEAVSQSEELVGMLSVAPFEQRTVVSVVVVSANDAEALVDTLASIREQSFQDWECLIVDDASLDRTVAEAWRYVSIDHRFSVIKHMAPQGLPAARNTGLRSASGTLVAFLRAGDVLPPDSLLQRVEAYSQSGIEGTAGSVSCPPRATPLGRDGVEESPIAGRFGVLDLIATRGTVPFVGRDVLCRADVLRALGGFREAAHLEVADAECWHRVMRSGCCLAASDGQPVGSSKRAMASDPTELAEIVEGLARVDALSDAPAGEIYSVPEQYEPLRDPIWKYARWINDSRRAVESAAACLGSGDRTAALDVLDKGLSASWPLLRRHGDLERSMERGFAAGLGIRRSEVRELDADIAPLFDELLSTIEVRAAVPRVDADVKTIQRYGVLFCPQTAHQARAMLDIATSLPEHRTSAFVTIDAISGDQGVANVLADSGAETMSFNDWMLSEVLWDHLVVGYPRVGVAEGMVGVSVRASIPVTDVELGGESVTRLPEARVQESGVVRRSVIETKKALADASENARSERAVSDRDMIQQWGDAVKQNPDTTFAIEEEPVRWSDGAEMTRFLNKHAGERCVIVGNGPSLNELDLSLLAGEITFGVNGIFYAADAMGFDPTYYVVEDTMVMADNLERIREYRAGHKLFPSIYREMVGEAANVTYFTMNGGFYSKGSPSFCIPRFSTDASQRVYSGQSVTTINLQLAYYMGFTEVVLIGMDFSYIVPEDSEIEGHHILSRGADPNHFHPDYFGAGKTWKDPKLDRVLANYQLAKDMFTDDGRRIVNATPGGKLEIFERADYGSLFRR